MEDILVTLENTTKSVKVLKAFGLKTLRVIPGFNYVDCTEDEMKQYAKSAINKSIIKESIRLVDVKLSEEDDIEAKKALATNTKLNKAQKVIDKQNKQILEKDNANNSQAKMIKEQGDLIAEMMKKIEELEKKGKK